MTLYIVLFLVGLLTVLLPCVLPLLPIVLGVSVAGMSKWRPVSIVSGMIVSFTVSTFLLLTVLRNIPAAADIVRTSMELLLLLFGVGFVFERQWVRISIAALGGLYFFSNGWFVIGIASAISIFLMFVGGRIASCIQGAGIELQGAARSAFGQDSLLTAFIIGCTLGFVWAPCAGPALAFVFTLVREEAGITAFSYLLTYALGAGVPLLLIGYGGQTAVRSVRALAPLTGKIKVFAGTLLIAVSLGLTTHSFERIQVWVLTNTPLGEIGTRFEEVLVKGTEIHRPSGSTTSLASMGIPTLPKSSVRAPELTGLSTWHNSQPLTMKELKGKVVLIDFWTYSCINCIRTLPYIQGYAEKFKDAPFVILGIHTPEFTFEKLPANVAQAIRMHKLTYPIAQDNDYGTWSAFANRYWPAKYLIDAQGYIRYTHFGEGAYDETDRAIQSLLGEIGVTATGSITVEAQARRSHSPETYLSSRSWPALGNSRGDPEEKVVTYIAPKSLKLNRYYLVGDWQLEKDEYQLLRSTTGEIQMKFLGAEANLVLAADATAKGAVAIDVFVDGKLDRTISVDHPDRYLLFSGAYGEHDLVLKIKNAGLQAFAFTFGS